MAQGEILEKKGGTILGNRAVSQELIILGNRIREYRKERGFSQEIFAEKSGVSTNTISRIEGGTDGNVSGDFTKNCKGS